MAKISKIPSIPTPPTPTLKASAGTCSDTSSKAKTSFPYSIIDGLASKFAKTYCKRLEVPPEFMYIAFLTCLGSVLAKKLTITTEIKPQPRLYILLLGESADDHKSTAIDKTVEFFEYALGDNNSGDKPQLNVCRGTGSAEGLAKILNKRNNTLLCYDEFKSFISKAKIQSSTLLQCVNSLFESNRYENQTSRSGIIIKNGLLSLLAASTIETYEAAWEKSFTAIGFNNRLFIVPGSGTRAHSIPPKIPDKDKFVLAIELRKIIRFVGRSRELNITTTAKDMYHEWYMSRPISIHSKRLDGYALRFMELIAVNKRAKIINAEIANSAIELMDWQFEMRRLHDPIDADNVMAKMEEKIRRVLSRKDGKTGKLVELADRKLKQFTNANRTGLFFYNRARNNLRDGDEIIFNVKTGLWSLNE